MASRASVRSSSRRNTPQSPPQSANNAPTASGPARRTTRSQSRDVNDGETSRPRNDRNTRGASIESAGSRGGRTGRSTARTKPLQDLSVVIEDSGHNPSDQEEEMNIAQAGNVRMSQHARDRESPESLSAVSATTARTSYSAQELADMDSVEMLDTLLDLSTASDRLFGFLMPEASSDTIEERKERLQDPTSRETKRVTLLAESFNVPKNIYGNEPYINVSIAVRGTMAVRWPTEVGSGTWRPDDIFYKANIAKFTMNVLALHPKSMHPWLEKMERDFPSQFLAKVTRGKKDGPGVSRLLQQTLDAAFNLRMQLFLSFLNRNYREVNFDPDILLKEIFYDNPTTISGWDIDGLRSHELTKQQQKTLTRELSDIQARFNKKLTINVDTLNSQYPRSSFVENVITWAKMRKDEIDGRLISHGGAPNIQAMLAAEIHRRAGQSRGSRDTSGDGNSPVNIQLDFQPPSEISYFPSDQPQQLMSAASGRSRSGASIIDPGYTKPSIIDFSKQKLAAIKSEQAARLQQSLSPARKRVQIKDSAAARPSTNSVIPTSRRSKGKQPATAPAKITNEPIIQDTDDWAPAQIEDDDQDVERRAHDRRRASPSARIHHILDLNRNDVAEQDKENRPQMFPATTVPIKPRFFTDRQPNAERILFDSQPEKPQEVPSSLSLKRPRPAVAEVEEEVSDVSEDTGFERDIRPHMPRSSLAKRGLVPKTRAKRVRLARPRVRSESVDTDIEAALVEANGPATGSQPPLSQAKIYKATQMEAKKLTSMHVPRRVQKRIPWSEEETERLLDLIGEYGTSWSLLKTSDDDEGKILKNRDQTGLKDKARNMKIDYLKSGVTLPANFNSIALKQTDWDKLHQLGIHRVERDEDSDDD